MIQDRSPNIASSHINNFKVKRIYYSFFFFSLKFSTRKGAITNKRKYSVEQLQTEKLILSLQNVQIVCIFILLNGKCIFISGLEK